MIYGIIYYLLLLLLTSVLTLIVVSLAICLYFKMKLEPVKSVCKSNARLDNKIVLVTGGNQGIGLETARDLASRGARVIIACRDEKRATQAVIDIIETTGNKNIEFKYLNLASFRSIRKFSEDFINSYDHLDILINNAGCAALKQRTSEDGIDLVMQVNYLGPFLLTNLLLDKIKSSSAGRIVIVSSCVHFFGHITANQLDGMHTKYQFMKYCNSKLCDILWMKALSKRLPSNVTVNSLHPGAVKTDFFKILPPIASKWVLFLLDLFNFKTPQEGAQTSIYLAVSAEVAGISGKYFMECAEAPYLQVADNIEFVDKVWNKSIMLTSA